METEEANRINKETADKKLEDKRIELIRLKNRDFWWFNKYTIVIIMTQIHFQIHHQIKEMLCLCVFLVAPLERSEFMTELVVSWLQFVEQ